MAEQIKEGIACAGNRGYFALQGVFIRNSELKSVSQVTEIQINRTELLDQWW